MTTKRAPAVGDTVEVNTLDRGWVPFLVAQTYGELGRDIMPPSAFDPSDTTWRWPGEAADGSRRGLHRRLPVAEKRRAVTLWLSPAERAELDAYAVREKAALSEAIRDAALRAARWKP